MCDDGPCIVAQLNLDGIADEDDYPCHDCPNVTTTPVCSGCGSPRTNYAGCYTCDAPV